MIKNDASRKYLRIHATLTVLLAAFAFSYALTCGFVGDDRTYFIENDILPTLKPWDLWAILTTPSNYWGDHLPLRDLLFVLEFNIFGLWAPGYHVVSLILYAALCLVVFQLVLKLYSIFSGDSIDETSRRWSALLVSALFILHPVHVEAAAYISSQKDLLYALFTFLSLFLFIKYLEDNRSLSLSLLTGAVACYYLAYLSKWFAISNAVAFPALWLLAGRPGRHRFHHVIAFWIILNIPAFLWMLYSMKILAVAGLTVTDVDLTFSLLRAIRILGALTLLVIFPYPLNFGYPFDQAWHLDATAIAGFTILAATLAALILRPRSLVTLGLCIYVLYFIPVVRLFVEILNAVIYDRYLFVPLLGAAILVERGFNFVQRYLHLTGKSITAGAISLCLVLAVLSNAYVRSYKSDVTMMEHGFHHYRQWNRIPFDYVYALIEAGELEKASRLTAEEPSFAKPTWVRDYFSGWICLESGDLECAIAHLTRALHLNMGRNYPFAEVQLGRAYLAVADYERAELVLNRVIKSRIHNPLEYYKAKSTLHEIEKIKEMSQKYQQP